MNLAEKLAEVAKRSESEEHLSIIVSARDWRELLTRLSALEKANEKVREP